MEYIDGNREYVKQNEYFIKSRGVKEELQAIYDRANSFYKKAYIISFGGELYLQSYDTIVAMLNSSYCEVFGWYSSTTARHINEFLQQYGFKKLTKKEMDKDICLLLK